MKHTNIGGARHRVPRHNATIIIIIKYLYNNTSSSTQTANVYIYVFCINAAALSVLRQDLGTRECFKNRFIINVYTVALAGVQVLGGPPACAGPLATF